MVDKMLEKYPNHTPFNYCFNNPVILVDPDGDEVGKGIVFPNLIAHLQKRESKLGAKGIDLLFRDVSSTITPGYTKSTLQMYEEKVAQFGFQFIKAPAATSTKANPIWDVLFISL
jgi:hypothetical protein